MRALPSPHSHTCEPTHLLAFSCRETYRQNHEDRQHKTRHDQQVASSPRASSRSQKLVEQMEEKNARPDLTAAKYTEESRPFQHHGVERWEKTKAELQQDELRALSAHKERAKKHQLTDQKIAETTEKLYRKARAKEEAADAQQKRLDEEAAAAASSPTASIQAATGWTNPSDKPPSPDSPTRSSSRRAELLALDRAASPRQEPSSPGSRHFSSEMTERPAVKLAAQLPKEPGTPEQHLPSEPEPEPEPGPEPDTPPAATKLGQGKLDALIPGMEEVLELIPAAEQVRLRPV